MRTDRVERRLLGVDGLAGGVLDLVSATHVLVDAALDRDRLAVRLGLKGIRALVLELDSADRVAASATSGERSGDATE